MKKFMSLVLALVMVMAMMVPAMAATGTNDNSGKITIENPAVGQTYTIYQILVLESYDTESKAYAYKANDAWATWLAGQTQYVNIDEQGYVTWVANTDDTTVAAFAKAAQAYAKENSIPNQGTATAAEGQAVEFTGLNLGYYLVDTTLGALCSLDTTEPNVTIKEKNTVPTIDKQVKEDSTGEYGDSNTAQVGDTVTFQTTVHAKYGAQNYIVHDKMSEGLTFQSVSSVKNGSTTLTAGTDYTVVTADICADCDFHVVFTQDYLNTITGDTDIVIEYTAILNDKAVISTDANTNDTKLSYGEESKSETEWDHTDTYTFKFDIVKTNSDNKVITGAKFELYDAQTAGNKIALVKEADGTYRIATEAERTAEGFTSAVIEVGQAIVEGLDANTTYWLEETVAPDGYNKLPARVEVNVENSNLTATVEDGVWTAGGVHVVNQKGAELPSTGGMGTTMMYIGGGLLVAFAVIMLATKRRMNAAE